MNRQSTGQGAAIMLNPAPPIDGEPDGYSASAIGTETAPQIDRYLANLGQEATIIIHPSPVIKKAPEGYVPYIANLEPGTGPEAFKAAKEQEARDSPAPDMEASAGQAEASRPSNPRFEGGRVWPGDGNSPGRTRASRQPGCRRTRAGAGETTALVDDIALITDKLYRHALTPIQNGAAFIMPTAVANALGIGNGAEINEFTLSLENCDPKDIGKLDFALLATVYSIILHQLNQSIRTAQDHKEVLRILEDQHLDYVVQLFLPAFLEKIGAKPDGDESRFAVAREKLESFKDVVGIHMDKSQWGVQCKRYDVMRWISDDTETNTVRFSSPYCNDIAKLLLKKHLKTDKRGNLEMSPGGPPAMSVSHSYALKTVLASERNKMAVEIVCYVAYVIETTGRSGGTPHASARTILNECPRLKHRVATAKSTSDKNKYLKRAFERAWKILGDPRYSDLAEKHEDLQIPTEIPKMQTLDKVVYRFSSRAEESNAMKMAKKGNRKKGS